jgi:sirohydrochlorin ferrochelatase
VICYLTFMGILQDELDKAIDDTPRVVLVGLLQEKLADRGISDPDLAERLTAAILANDSDVDETEVDLPCDLEFTEADHEHVNAAVERLVEGMPNLLEKMGQDMGRGIADECRAQWEKQATKATEEREMLQRKIAAKWSEAFSDLRLLLELCIDHGDTFNHAHLTSRLKRNRVRNEVLSRLHIRACKIADEIITLLENGFAEGARARWRTMFEVSVTALLMVEGGDLLAQRYLDHEAVERKKALDDHDRAATISGVSGLDVAERKGIESDLARVVRKYGSAFRGMYGWAAGQLGLGNQPQFHDLQKVAGTLAMKLEYRLACLSVHASPRMLSQPMHQWDPTLCIPGVFAAGFEEPGINAAYTLVQVTSVLFEAPWDLDRLVQMRALSFLRDDVEARMLSTARRIEREEQRAIERAIRRPSHPASYGPRRRSAKRRY